MVVGSLAARSAPTGWRCLKLSPRFPLTAPLIQIRYCWGRHLSGWDWAVRAARVSLLILLPLVMEPMGSEGTSRIRKKISTDTTRSMGTRKMSRLRIYRTIKFILYKELYPKKRKV
jgi:hypothetical protein